jgi:beta-phosphoglucomutase-like phosphatase (HAD superfamily)
MTNIIIPHKIGVALDVDGTLIDTNRECYERVREAWQDKYHNDFPLSYEQFLSFRPWVRRSEDYFSFSRMMIDNKGSLPENFKELNDEYLSHPDIQSLKELFYEHRERKMKADIYGWLAENNVYEGIPEMVSDLEREGWIIFVITSKDRKSVEQLLSHYNLDGPIARIFDKDYGDRIEQFAKASNELRIEPTNILTYDDLLPQLQAARSCGMKPICAPQGYGIKEEIEKAGFPFAFPNQFIKVAKGLIEK